MAKVENPFHPEQIQAWMEMIEVSYNKKAWHGKNLRSTVKGMDAATAHRLPPGKPVSIWQIVLHCGYWCNRVRMRVSGEKGRTYPRKGSDWLPQPPEPDEAQWKADKDLLWHEYDLLVDYLRDLKAGKAKVAVDPEEAESLIIGAAFHAIYHGSQITQFRRLLEA